MTRPTYTPPPPPPARADFEAYDAIGFGFACLLYACDPWQIGLLELEHIEAAIHVYPIAIANREMDPGARDRLTNVRRRLTRLQTARQAEQAQQATDQAPEGIPPTPDHDTTGGTRVPLHPYPTQQPPSAGQLQPIPAPRPREIVSFDL